LDKAYEPVSDTRFTFQFLASPTRILGDTAGCVNGLEVEDTRLILKDGDTKARSLGTQRVLDVDTVIFCIGDRVDEQFGLPIQWNAFVKNPNPRYAVNDCSYEAYDPDKGEPIDGVFFAGWSREASSGLVGIARKDGECGAQAVLEYLSTMPEVHPSAPLNDLRTKLAQLDHPVVDKEAVGKLDEIEEREAERLGLEMYKMKSNEEMLKALGLAVSE
jgi:ferredoxin--NADP+ reductase